MPPKSKSKSIAEDVAEFKSEVARLGDLVEILTTAVENLATEIQWQNNGRSQQYHAQHLPLTKIPLDPAAKEWHPVFGRSAEPASPPPAAPTRASRSTLFG